jgi:hypothetical protein
MRSGECGDDDDDDDDDDGPLKFFDEKSSVSSVFVFSFMRNDHEIGTLLFSINGDTFCGHSCVLGTQNNASILPNR